MLDARKNKSRERIIISKKTRAIKWLTDFILERLDSKTDKKRFWIKADFVYN